MEIKNKLIAEFMYPNWVHPKKEEENITDYLEACNGSYFVLAQLIAEDYTALRYHSSLDALMPVVDKIEEDNNGLHVDIYCGETLVVKSETGVELCGGYGRGRLNNTYIAVVEFIEHHNRPPYEDWTAVELFEHLKDKELIEEEDEFDKWMHDRTDMIKMAKEH